MSIKKHDWVVVVESDSAEEFAIELAHAEREFQAMGIPQHIFFSDGKHVAYYVDASCLPRRGGEPPAASSRVEDASHIIEDERAAAGAAMAARRAADALRAYA